MKSFLCLVIVTISLFVPTLASAQTADGIPRKLLPPDSCLVKYQVHEGDFVHNPYGRAWQRFYEANRGLQDRVSVDSQGKLFVMLSATRGDVLCIPSGIDISDVMTYASNLTGGEGGSGGSSNQNSATGTLIAIEKDGGDVEEEVKYKRLLRATQLSMALTTTAIVMQIIVLRRLRKK